MRCNATDAVAGEGVTVITLLDGITVVGTSRMYEPLGHLICNAQEATPLYELVNVYLIGSNNAATVPLLDTGCGMTPMFVRMRLSDYLTAPKVAKERALGLIRLGSLPKHWGMA